MSDELGERLWAECPRKILGCLHLRGTYRHYHSDRFPGRVLCFHRAEAGTVITEGMVPTPAQQEWNYLGRDPHRDTIDTTTQGSGV